MTDQTNSDLQSENPEVAPEAVANHADIVALRAELAALGDSVSAATNGLKLHRSEEDVLKRMRERFTYTLIIVAVISFFGIQSVAYLLIDQTWGRAIDDRVHEATVSVSRAEVTVEFAEEAARKADKAADDANRKVEQTTGRLDEIDMHMKAVLQAVEVDVAKVQSEIAAATDSVRAFSNSAVADLQEQLNSVGAQVLALSKESKINVATFQEQQVSLRNQAIATQSKFTENAGIQITVHAVSDRFFQDAAILVNSLTMDFGYVAYMPSYSPLVTFPSGMVEPPTDIQRSNTRYATIIYGSATGDPNTIERKVSELAGTLRDKLPTYKITKLRAGAKAVQISKSTALGGIHGNRFSILLANWVPKVTDG